MKVLLFGAAGQVGRETIIAAAEDPSVRLVALTRAEADLAAPNAGRDAIRREAPDVVINAAAWTKVDAAETEWAAAERLNATAVGELAAASREMGARFVHISTDYVFAGDKKSAPLNEDAPTGALNAYGRTKLEGERLAIAAHPASVILRTSWVFSAHGSNFLKTMLRLAETRDEINVVADQIGGPTPASAIASACLKIAAHKSPPGGVYHFQGAPAASWAEFAEAIFQAAGKPVRVNRIATRDYPMPARRPLFTVLDCSKIAAVFGVAQPDWRGSIKATIGLVA